MTRSAEARRDPLGPFEVAVTALMALIAALVMMSVPAAVFGNGSFLGLGDKEACAVTRPGVVPFGERDVPGHEDSMFIPGLRSDARFSVDRIEVCDRDPGIGVKAASSADPAAHLVLLGGFLLLSRRLIRHARSAGLFTTSVASRTSGLGWYLFGGALTTHLVAAIGHGVVVSSAVRGVAWGDGLRNFDVPLTLVVVALGIVTVGRVLRQAVELQDEVDATI